LRESFESGKSWRILPLGSSGKDLGSSLLTWDRFPLKNSGEAPQKIVIL